AVASSEPCARSLTANQHSALDALGSSLGTSKACPSVGPSSNLSRDGIDALMRQLCNIHFVPEHDPAVVQRRLEEFRKNLLDISLRNRLVNFKTRTKSGKDLEKVVEVTGESPAELHRLLVLEKKAMRFGGKPDPKSAKGNQVSVLKDVDHLA